MCQAERGGEDNVILMQGPLIFYNSSIDSMFLHCIKPQSSSSSASCKVWHAISCAQFFRKPSLHLYVVTYDNPASISWGQQVYAKKSTKRIQAWDKHSIMNNNIVKSKASEFLEWLASISINPDILTCIRQSNQTRSAPSTEFASGNQDIFHIWTKPCCISKFWTCAHLDKRYSWVNTLQENGDW